MTRYELRVLYLLHKHGGRVRHSVISQSMSRITAVERERALAAVEDFGLISSAGTPPTKKGGRGGRVYWLTALGKQTVEDMIARGELTDPATEPRRRQ